MIGASGDHANVLAELVGFGFFKGLFGEGGEPPPREALISAATWFLSLLKKCRSISWGGGGRLRDGGGGRGGSADG
jgi:hypothetical protein